MVLRGELKNFILFNSGNSGLTQQFIYANLPMKNDEKIVVLSASKYYRKVMGYVRKDARIGQRELKSFEGETVLVVRKGFAGKMHYYKDLEYTINEDAYVITVKEEYKKKINLQWFAFFFQKLFFNIATSREGNGTFSKEYAERQYVEIPEKSIQEQELILYKMLQEDSGKLQDVVEKIDELLERIVVSSDVKKYIIKDIFYMDTGKRIVKQGLYSVINTKHATKEDIVPIISSGVEDEGVFGYASVQWLDDNYRRKNVKEKEWVPWHNYANASYIISEPCVTWNTDGAAGTLFYRENKFFPTDHCGVLIPKEEYKDEINLKYFVYSQQYKFRQQSDRGNLHLREMSSQIVELPDIKIQNEVCCIVENLREIRKILILHVDDINETMKRELCMIDE